MTSNKIIINKNSQDKTLQQVPQATLAQEFKQLFEADNRRLYSYIHAFTGNYAATDDIFQETCLTLWQEFEKFELGTNFSKWANSIAFRRVRDYRRSQKKYLCGFSDELLEELQEIPLENDSLSIQQERKLTFLEQCRALLSAPLQQVYQSFYIQNRTATEIAADTGRSIHAIRKAVHKIRKQVFDCIDNKKLEDSA